MPLCVRFIRLVLLIHRKSAGKSLLLSTVIYEFRRASLTDLAGCRGKIILKCVRRNMIALRLKVLLRLMLMLLVKRGWSLHGRHHMV